MWHFKKTQYDDTIAESKLSEFFSSQKCEAIVREAVQNSGDASNPDVSDPVKVVFSFNENSIDDFSEAYDELNLHWSSFDKDTIPQKFKSLLIEDFNTTGLKGPIDKNQKEGSLYSFWWEEGRSNKRVGSGGSHGVGKSTLSSASRYNTFFALTRRKGSYPELLLGYTILPPHNLNEVEYLGYARFGHHFKKDGEDVLHPYVSSRSEGKKAIEAFKKHAQPVRQDEDGLSVFIPCVHEDINFKNTILSVIRNYYLPIIKGNMVIEVNDFTQNQCLEISKSTIGEIADKYFEGEKDHSDIKFLIRMAYEIVRISSERKYFYASTDVDFSRDNDRITPDSFSTTNLELMKEKFREGQIVPVSLNVPIIFSDGSSEQGYARVYAWNLKDQKQKLYKAFRGDILIFKERCSAHTPFTAVVVDVFNDGSKNQLSEYMKYTEDPGHGEWKNSAVRRSGKKYQHTESWQRAYVQRLASSIIAVLSGSEENEKLSGFASDIFYFEKEVLTERTDDNTSKGSTKSKSGDKPTGVPLDLPSPRPSLFSVDKMADGGVQIKATSALKDFFASDESQRVHARFKAAHVMPGVSKAKWFSSYNTADFDFSDDIEIDVSGAEILDADKNILNFSTDNPDFEIRATGFDSNRDLHIEVRKMEEAQW